jgi:hypothetical protein
VRLTPLPDTYLVTARELAAALLALPEEQQDLQVFSTADWSTVTYVGIMDDYTIDGQPVVELS